MKFVLVGLLLVAAAGGVRIYPSFNDVSAHPDVAGRRYGAPHPDFASFGNRSRWATRGQFCDVAEYSKLLDMFFAAGMMGEGDLTAIHWGMLACPPATFRAAMRMVQRRGVRVSGVWGTFPGPGPASGVDGPPYRERFGAQLAALDDIFGPTNWMGKHSHDGLRLAVRCHRWRCVCRSERR